MEEIIAGAGCFMELWMIQIYAAIVFRKKICFRPFSCFLFIWNGVIAYMVNFGSCPAAALWSVYLFLALYCCKRFHLKWKENVVRLGIVILMTGVTEILASLLELAIHFIYDSGNWRFAIVNAAGLLIAAGSYLTVKMHRETFDRRISILYQLSFVCAAPVIIMILDYYEDHELQLLYDVVIFIIIAVVIMYFNRLQEIESKLRRKELDYELHEVYGKKYEDAIADMRRRQHSYRNQLLAINGIYACAQPAGKIRQRQEDYCAALEEDGKYDAILMKCNDIVMAGFLFYKCLDCEKQGVAVRYEIRIDELKCVLMLHELVEIAGILMDNACEKVVGMQEKDRYISLHFIENAKYIVIETANRSEEKRNNEIEHMFESGYSSKGIDRGFGLARMKQIAGRYRLDIQVENRASDSGNLLVFRLIIPK